MSQNDTFIESNKPLEHQSQYQSTLHRITQPITARYSVALMCGLHVHKQSNYCTQQFSFKSIKRICIFTFSQIAKWSTFSFRLFPFYHPKRGAGRYYLAKYISQDSWINMKFFTSLASPNLHENNLSLQFHCRFLPVKYHLMDAAIFNQSQCCATAFLDLGSWTNSFPSSDFKPRPLVHSWYFLSFIHNFDLQYYTI